MAETRKIRSVFFALHLYRTPECAAFYSSLKETAALLLDLTHYDGDIPYFGNYHEYLKKLPGGINYKE